MVHVIVFAAALSLYRDLNRERLAHGLPPLILDARLAGVADAHATDMARRNYFAHESRDGASPFDRMRAADCAFQYAGENIALAQDERVADSALFGSTPHRENTLSAAYRRVGIGVAAAPDGDLYFVEDFSD